MVKGQQIFKTLKNNQILEIREAQPSDAANMIEYLNKIGGESDNLLFGLNEFRLSVDEEMTYLEKSTKDNNSLMLLGLIEEKIVSVAMISSQNRKRIEHFSEVSLSVSKSMWRNGIGKIMLTELIDFAIKHDKFTVISLGVRSININAIMLYESLGFERVGLHKNFFKIKEEYYDELLMDLYLNKK